MNDTESLDLSLDELTSAANALLLMTEEVVQAKERQLMNYNVAVGGFGSMKLKSELERARLAQKLAKHVYQASFPKTVSPLQVKLEGFSEV